MSWTKWERAAERGPEAMLWKVGILILSATVLIGGVSFVLMPFIQGGRIVEKTMDADNVLYNYEWFKQQWRSIQAIDRKIVVQREAAGRFTEVAGPRSDWTREDKIEHARLDSIVVGLKQQRADMVATYNARASMANRSIFMGGDCPNYIQ
jgi:hypothetical protein